MSLFTLVQSTERCEANLRPVSWWGSPHDLNHALHPTLKHSLMKPMCACRAAQAVFAKQCRNVLLHYVALFSQKDIPAYTELTYDVSQHLESWIHRCADGLVACFRAGKHSLCYLSCAASDDDGHGWKGGC